MLVVSEASKAIEMTVTMSSESKGLIFVKNRSSGASGYNLFQAASKNSHNRMPPSQETASCGSLIKVVWTTFSH